MSKRHNRKRTRSRPRHRDPHSRNSSLDSASTITPSITPSPPPYHHHLSSYPPLPPTINTTRTPPPVSHLPANHWHQTYLAWQSRVQDEQDRQREVEMQRLRIFGGLPGEAGQEDLLEPMLKVVTDLFDGFTDYEDP